MKITKRKQQKMKVRPKKIKKWKNIMQWNLPLVFELVSKLNLHMARAREVPC
jgi:hypothetical protein